MFGFFDCAAAVLLDETREGQGGHRQQAKTKRRQQRSGSIQERRWKMVNPSLLLPIRPQRIR